MQNNVSKGLTVNKTLILIALGMFTFMSTLDGSIVNIAMPIMSKELSVTASQIEWVVSIYLIIISSLLMFFGRLGDVVGKTRIFKIGTAIFIIGLKVCQKMFLFRPTRPSTG
jgi:MFS family permease